MSTVASLKIRIGADWSEAQKAFNSVQKAISPMADRLQSIGSALSTYVTGPLVAFGAVALKSSIDFESAFAGVRKTVSATEPQLAALEKGIREMSKEIPASANEIAGVAEAAGQLGIELPNILGFTRVMIDLGETTNLQAGDAATALARLANITQMPQSEFDRLGSTVVALGNRLATTEAEIVEMGLRLAGAGKQVGLTEAQILGFAGALSSVGIEAEAGGTAFSKVFIDISNAVQSGGEGLSLFARVAGMSTAQFRQAFQADAAGAIVSFVEGLGRISAEGGNTFAVLEALGFSEIRVRDALLRASGAGDLFRQSIQIGSEAWRENTALTAEAAQRYDTTAAKLQILWNRLTDVTRTIGDALKPALVDLMSGLEPVFKMTEGLAVSFKNADGATKALVMGIAALAAALGPLLFSIGSLVKLAPVFAAGFSVATGPIGLVVGGIAAATVASIGLYKLWQEMAPFMANKFAGALRIVNASLLAASGNRAGAIKQLLAAVDVSAMGASLVEKRGAEEARLEADMAAEAEKVASAMQAALKTALAGSGGSAWDDLLGGEGAKGTPALLAAVDALRARLQQALVPAGQLVDRMNQVFGPLMTKNLVNQRAPTMTGAEGRPGEGDMLPLIDPSMLRRTTEVASMAMDELALKLAEKREQFAELTAAIGNTLKEGLISGITALAEGFGAMAAGTASLGDVGKNLLQVFANVMQTLGGMIIAYGVAGEKWNAAGGFLSFLNPLSAGAVIAIGAALVAGGAAIKGYLSRSSSRSGGARTSGVSSVGVNANAASTAGSGAGFSGSQGAASQAQAVPMVNVTITPRVLPSGDVVFSQGEGGRRLDRYGTLMA